MTSKDGDLGVSNGALESFEHGFSIERAASQYKQRSGFVFCLGYKGRRKEFILFDS